MTTNRGGRPKVANPKDIHLTFNVDQPTMRRIETVAEKKFDSNRSYTIRQLVLMGLNHVSETDAPPVEA